MIADPRWHPRTAGMVAIGAAAALLMLPALFGPTPLNDSHPLNIVWAEQFTAGMRAGDMWPRWLPASFDGLGAPVFYFYGPVAFWAVGLLGVLGLSSWPAIAMVGMAAIAAFGMGVFALLRDEGAPRALPAAMFAVVAPYHLLDLLRRGALAEGVAIALLPWIALAIRRAVAGSLAPLAVVYAALIATHPPTAVLASIFLLPVLVLDSDAGDLTARARIGIGMALGIGLAAAYWLPALLLQHHANMAAMQDAVTMHPTNWRASWYVQGGNPALALLLAVIVALAIPAALLRGSWGWFALAGLALALGLGGPIWLLPPLDRVQFPWRILGLAEFGIAMAIGRSRIDGAALLLLLAPAVLVTVAVLAPSLLMLGEPQPTRQLAALLRHHPDAAEYRPHAADRDVPSSSSRPSRDGSTIVRRFAFPIWAARCPFGTVATGASPSGLVRYRGRGCAIVRVTTRAERLGSILSLVSLAGVAMIAVPRRTRTHPALRLGSVTA